MAKKGTQNKKFHSQDRIRYRIFYKLRYILVNKRKLVVMHLSKWKNNKKEYENKMKTLFDNAEGDCCGFTKGCPGQDSRKN